MHNTQKYMLQHMPTFLSPPTRVHCSISGRGKLLRGEQRYSECTNAELPVKGQKLSFASSRVYALCVHVCLPHVITRHPPSLRLYALCMHVCLPHLHDTAHSHGQAEGNERNNIPPVCWCRICEVWGDHEDDAA